MQLLLTELGYYMNYLVLIWCLTVDTITSKHSTEMANIERNLNELITSTFPLRFNEQSSKVNKYCMKEKSCYQLINTYKDMNYLKRSLESW